MAYTETLFSPSLNENEKCLFSFEKNHREVVRISDVLYQGRPYVDLRVFTRNKYGEVRPTNRGITVSRDLLPKLQEAFNQIV